MHKMSKTISIIEELLKHHMMEHVENVENIQKSYETSNAGRCACLRKENYHTSSAVTRTGWGK